MDQEPQNSSEENACGAVCLFYTNNPLSDFAPCSLIIDDVQYASVEHYVQIQMLRSFGLFKLANKLSTISDASEFRRALRTNLKSLVTSGLFDDRMFEAWKKTNTGRQLKKANSAKIEQNLHIKDILLKTGDRLLVFTSKHDRLLGVGMCENEFLNWIREKRWSVENLLDYFSSSTNFTFEKKGENLGRNLLGFSLMDLRAEISGRSSAIADWKINQRPPENLNFEIPSHSESESREKISDDDILDQQILDKLTRAENEIRLEKGEKTTEDGPEKSIVVKIPGEKRLVFYKNGVNDGEKRKLALERLKALRFEKPMVNPFAFAMEEARNYPDTSQKPQEKLKEKIVPKSPRNICLQKSRLVKRTNRRRPIPRLPVVPPYQLEPGEVPPPNFFGTANQKPPSLLSIPTVAPLDAYPGPSISPYSLEVDPAATETWQPPKNAMASVLDSAKTGLKKLIENGKFGKHREKVLSLALTLKPPPIRADQRAKKRKKPKAPSVGMCSKIFFASKDVQKRHMADRWIKGGRLTTTGEFEECAGSGDDSEASTSNFNQEPAADDAETPSEPVQIHVSFEDTNEYAAYVNWYAEVHGYAPSNRDNDEYHRYLRQWYTYYRTAVKFVDVEPASTVEECAYEEPEAPSAAGQQMTDAERRETLMQQWRWQQINEWDLRFRNQQEQLVVAQETYEDGISFGGKPLKYSHNDNSCK